MILTAHQPTFLPWLGLFDKVAQADTFCLFDTCQAEDSGFENRNRILGPSGVQWLTVPVHKGREVPLHEVRIVHEGPWRRKQWRSLEAAYGKHPFWRRYAPALERF